MSDDQELVKRLREVSGVALMREAVDAIERLTQAVAERDGQLEVAIGHIDHVTAERDAAYQAGAMAMQEACATLYMAKQQTWINGKMTSEIELPYDTDLSRRIRAIDPASVKP